MLRYTEFTFLHIYLTEFIQYKKKLETWQGKCWAYNLREDKNRHYVYIALCAYCCYAYVLTNFSKKGSESCPCTPNQAQLTVHFQLENSAKPTIFLFEKKVGRVEEEENLQMDDHFQS